MSVWALSAKGEVVLSIVAYSFCSGSLVLVNKLILHFIPFPSLVTTCQLWATLFFVYSAACTGWIEVDPIKWKFVVPYLAYTVAFSLGVYCNMKSLSLSNVETVIVFRALAPLLVSVLDANFLGREWPSLRSWGALLVIALGAFGYALTDEKFQTQGLSAYTWPTLYLLVISFEMAYGKNIIKSVDLKTLSGPVIYTNMLGWPPMLMFAAAGGEFERINNVYLENSVYMFPKAGVALLFVGCIIGTGIGYSGWWCRGKVSATSYTLIGVMNKFLTVLMNCLVWDQHAVPAGIACLFLCLVGGSFYRQAPMRQKDEVKEITSDRKNEVESTKIPDKSEEKKPLMHRGGGRGDEETADDEANLKRPSVGNVWIVASGQEITSDRKNEVESTKIPDKSEENKPLKHRGGGRGDEETADDEANT
eukprot:CAMPEP_0113547380 /NCGR_PEP_ID=MMETSP0015_2-20120614/12321_1 /TAXON_ID=2838 /ORGANISM="Odontella" /LENGTH=419 /DNA_ID=CAMNT_0000447923 /DNA_START=92 /DNA_END=1352 /DNA_ORIENTATION=- /assembly_acc=CAM_ASM_000160